MKRKLLFAALCAMSALGGLRAQTDVTASFVGDVTKYVVGGHNHGDNTVEHRLDQAAWPQGSAWWNDQTLPSGWHAFNENGGASESWTPGIGSAGVMMGRTMILPEGNYTLSFKAFGCTASNATNQTASSAGDVVAFCTGQENVDITNTTLGGNTFHDVSFTFDVTTANSVYSFGIRKMTNESYSDWCQIKDVRLVLNSKNITPVDNSVTTGWTQTFSDENNKVGDFAANVASVEGNKDGTNYLAPFIQVWKASGNILSDQTISNTFTPTQTGVYKMSAWVRVYNEAGGEVSGAKIFIGDTEADACTGNAITNGRLGTYTAMADGVAGTPITYGFKIQDATMNWISWKNVTFTYYSEMPEAEKTALLNQVPTGKMNASVETALNDYKTSFESNASVANYNALSLYLPTATASVDAYSNIATAISTYATKVQSLDAAGQAAYDATAIQTKYDNGTYTTAAEAEAELSAAYVVAVKAQTTANSNMTDAVAGAACETTSDFANWSITGGNTFELNTWSTENDASGLIKPFIQDWRNGADQAPLTDATIRHAAITGLHAGNYKVTVFARTFNETSGTVYPKNVTFVAIGDDTWSVDMNSGTQAVYNNKTLCYGTYTAYATLANDNGTILFGFDIADATGNWLAFKNVSLTLVSAEEVEAAKLTNAKANLRAALLDAPAVPTVNVGTGAFQYNQTEVNTLSSTISSAQAMLEEGSTATAAEVEAVIATVKALTEPSVNAPAAGVQYRIKSTASESASWKNKYYRLYPNTAQAHGGYSISADATDAFKYINWTFTAVEGGYTLSMTDADEVTRYLCTNIKGYDEGSATQLRTTTEATKALVVKVIANTDSEGRWYLQNTEDNSYIGGQDAGLYSNSQNYDLAIEAAAETTVEVNVAADKFATRIFPFAPGAIDGITFYTATVADNKVSLTEVAEPAANVPYILKASKDVNTSVSGWGTATADSYTEGALTGVYTAATIAAGANNYVLQTQNDVQAFYKVDADFTATAYRAYLTAEAAGEVKALFFDFGGETAIKGVEAADMQNATMYNLAGQRVNKAQKGIYIVNGKKVLVK